jgi:hypothetical protein
VRWHDGRVDHGRTEYEWHRVSHGLRSLVIEDEDDDEDDYDWDEASRFQGYLLYQGGEIQFVDWLRMRDSSVSHHDDPVTNAEDLG